MNGTVQMLKAAKQFGLKRRGRTKQSRGLHIAAADFCVSRGMNNENV